MERESHQATTDELEGVVADLRGDVAGLHDRLETMEEEAHNLRMSVERAEGRRPRRGGVGRYQRKRF